MNISQPVPSAIGSVDFGFLSKAEIQNISVKRIQNPQTFDSLLHPTPAGLYDHAMGAWGDAPCATCHLSAQSCPGHPGHIELPVPVYHPTFMNQLLRLLRAKCAYCHHLKMSRKEVNLYVCTLRLIQHGLLDCVSKLEDLESTSKENDKPAAHPSDEDEENNSSRDIIELRLQFVKSALKAEKSQTWEWRSGKNDGVAEARRGTIKSFLKSMNAGKRCSNCKGISPGYRKDRFVKIFEQSLSAKERAKMSQGDFKLVNPVKLKQKLNNHERSNGFHSDEGIADIDLSSNEEDEDEGEGDDLDVDGDLVMGNNNSMKSSTSTKRRVAPPPQRYLSPTEVQSSLELLFENEQEIFSLIYNSRSPIKKGKPVGAVSCQMFFIQNLLVPPNKFRPEAKTGAGEITEAQQNSLYKQILTHSQTIVQIHREIRNFEQVESARRRRDFGDLQETWVRLQDSVNSLLDRDRNPIQGAAGKKNEDGIKQKLEKKEGLFRKNMMGKRVNFAARSVISPDPNIETNEIGVPPVFARKLTYPEPVTSHNFREMQQAVINGCDKWPGASAIENENGQVISLKTKTQDERQSLANQLLASSNTSSNGGKNKKVHRHLTDGDVVLMNRQPTLHKPSIMGHRAKVLHGEKTIRMHYANCNTYNADFDGDEMNMHFPQSEIARAEALQIADTDHQYLSATAGKPLRGLIQDHLSVSVWMSSRDTFFDRSSYQQLLYNCLRPESNHVVGDRIRTVPPAIFKPRALWTGKQIVTTILMNIVPGSNYSPLNMSGKSQVPADRWGAKSEEGVVLFRDGHFITGILDKSQLGPSGGGLLHSVHEVYGPTVAGKLLSIFGRLLTKFLHMRAFTCGMDDLKLTAEGEITRREKLKEAKVIGLEVAAKYVALEDRSPKSEDPELRNRLEEVLRDDSKQQGLDLMMNARSNGLSSKITMECLPSGLVKQFPKNQMQAMTVSGAKGSAVNANLISCNLGQQVLEGRRVPVMVSGKSLPCFHPYDTDIKAGGYVSSRFLTGIRPQEYYFHAMAGREGLIDTAVKTSRSGYLQRCLIKGMEGLKVEYDASVRDSDGSVVQFLYGEDALDVTKQKHLMDFKFLLENIESEIAQMQLNENLDQFNSHSSEIKKLMKKALRSTAASSDPIISRYNPGRYLHATSEKFYLALTEYLKTNPDKLVTEKGVAGGNYSRRILEPILNMKYLRSVVEPGESVGIVAAQSVGEPSTQMTLNTFHLAGHSNKNVTLGIPRLREIVMTASTHISTPAMTLFVNEELTKEDGERFAKAISKLTLAEVVKNASVSERIGKGVEFSQARIFEIDLEFFSAKEYTETYAIAIADVSSALEMRFIPRLHRLIRKALGQKKSEAALKSTANTAAVPEIGVSVGTIEQVAANNAGEDEGGADEDDDGDDDATNDKRKANQGQAVSYDDNDEDDNAVQKQMENDSTLEDVDDMEDEGIGGSPGNLPGDSYNEQEHGDNTKNRPAHDQESRIMSKNNDVTAFSFDEETGASCKISLEYDAHTPKILVLNVIETALHSSVVQQIDGLGSCVYSAEEIVKDRFTGQDKKVPVVQTTGVNLKAMQAYGDMINPNKISTNDIAAMLDHYGVEACRATIIGELSGIFGAYGIGVDNRHLNLIADCMTRGGGFRPFNRNGLTGNVSPFLKMSFETTIGFLRDAVMDGDWDDLRSPSSRIVVGRTSKVGTGAFDILTRIPTVA